MANNHSFFSLLTGLAAGAVLGILFAPDKGWKTRARVRKAAENGFEDLQEETASARETLSSLKDTLFEHGAELKEEARTKIIAQIDRLEKFLRGTEPQQASDPIEDLTEDPEDVDDQAEPEE